MGGAVQEQARCGAIALVLATLLSSGAVFGQGTYTLGPEDRVRLKVFEWRASRDETFSWEALNDEYALGSEGELSLPLVGKIDASGITRDELAERISAQLSERLGLGRRPSVAVEIVEYRPFYILGPVEEPGAYPYRPGLTVLRAVSLAGGIGTNAQNDPREVITGYGEMEILRLSRDAARVRIARLTAELASADGFAPPPELAGRLAEPSVARLVAQEQAIFAARRDAYRTRLAALEQLQADLQTEVPAQRAMLENVKSQVQSLREDLAALSTVVATLQVRSMEREAAKLDGERLRVETSLLRAQQEVSRANLAIVELRTQRAQDLAVDLRETQAALEQAERRIATTADLVAQAERNDPLALAAEGRSLTPTYSIVRNEDGKSVELAADEMTAVMPGDAIRVELRRESVEVPDSAM